jgi:hypothetical protein
VFYIFTFNDISKINKVLLDRLNVIYIEDGVTIDANKINIFNLDAEDEIKKAIEKSEDNKINLYKIKLGKGSNVIAFSNCIYYSIFSISTSLSTKLS